MLVCLCVEGLKWKSPPGGSNAVEKGSCGVSMATVEGAMKFTVTPRKLGDAVVHLSNRVWPEFRSSKILTQTIILKNERSQLHVSRERVVISFQS